VFRYAAVLLLLLSWPAIAEVHDVCSLSGRVRVLITDR
jgi:hypothetical protein